MREIRSRVWKETEETGYGVYYYEETTRLRTVLPGSNYRVEAVLANPTPQPYDCHIRINGIVKEEGITVLPTEEKEVGLTACVTDGECVLSFAIGKIENISENGMEGKVYLKSLVVTPIPEEPASAQLLQKPGFPIQDSRQFLRKPSLSCRKPRLFLVSDSTVQSYEPYYSPQAGWGQMLYRFFEGADACREYPAENCSYSLGRAYELPGIVIENRSIGGRSSKSFYEEGKLDQVLEIIRPGDYMLVQFAHNDATPARPNRYVRPEDFPFYLQRYVDACKRRGAVCVLVTPVAMRNCGEGDRFHISFRAYREKMLQMARSQRLPLLDLGARSTAYLNRIGSQESKKLYLWLAKGEYPDGAYADGVSDNGHLREYGAELYAGMVAGLIREYSADHYLDGLKQFLKK